MDGAAASVDAAVQNALNGDYVVAHRTWARLVERALPAEGEELLAEKLKNGLSDMKSEFTRFATNGEHEKPTDAYNVRTLRQLEGVSVFAPMKELVGLHFVTVSETARLTKVISDSMTALFAQENFLAGSVGEVL